MDEDNISGFAGKTAEKPYFLHNLDTVLSHRARIFAAFGGYTVIIKRRASHPACKPIEQNSSLSLPPSILVKAALTPGGFDLRRLCAPGVRDGCAKR